MPAYWNTPAGIQKRLQWPWWSVVLLFLVGAGDLAWELHKQLTPHTWLVPAQSQLLTVNGRFSPVRSGPAAAFIFETDNGKKINLGCAPERRSNVCLNDKIDLQELSQHDATIGYFVVPNAKNPRLSNVLATIEIGDVPIIGYSEGRARLVQEGKNEEGAKRNPIVLLLDMAGPMLLLFGSVFVGVTKIRFNGKASFDD